MYVDSSTVRRNGKAYTRHLLRTSFRERGKVKHKTIANLSHCSPDEIAAIRLALRHKHDLAQLAAVKPSISLQQGASVGAVWLLRALAHELGIADALGHDRAGKLALWQVIARTLGQGSRLSAVRLAAAHAACPLLRLDPFDEDDLYENLDWLAAHQVDIETRWGRRQAGQGDAGLFLYDVTSSYLEGTDNALAAFGYNRDGKRGKRQIVVGLLCDGTGRPLSIELFPGNTQDLNTFAAQVHKVAGRFGGGDVTFVGDRGMIKSRQIDDLAAHGFHYITAITKPQIDALLNAGVLQMDLFDDALAEVTSDDGTRYILRRNPERVAEIAASRDDKYRSLGADVARQNSYLADHPRAGLAVARRKLAERARKLRIDRWTVLLQDGREIRLEKDAAALADTARLDGCYALKTDLRQAAADKTLVHDRYKDLALVEWAFRDCKTVNLEIRPIYVRRESRTRGHALVVMFAYAILRELRARWIDLDMTVEEGLGQCATLCATEVHLKDHSPYQLIPQPRPAVRALFDAAGAELPAALPNKQPRVTTKTKLPERRKRK
jgi:hypothetical protein